MNTNNIPSYELRRLDTPLKNHCKVIENNHELGEIWEVAIHSKSRFYAKNYQCNQFHPRTNLQDGFNTQQEAIEALKSPCQPFQTIHDEQGSFMADVINEMPTHLVFKILMEAEDFTTRYNPLAAAT